MRYVVWAHEQLQDGHEYWAKVVDSIDEGLRFMEKMRPRVNPHNLNMKLFELGPEVQVEEVTVEEPQPPKLTTTYRSNRT